MTSKKVPWKNQEVNRAEPAGHSAAPDRYALFCALIDQLDQSCVLINKYDALLHDYNGVHLYQAESQMIKAIGDTPGITASEIASVLNKTGSACSQLISKLSKKGWVIQERNPKNRREYFLKLSKEGRDIYEKHRIFEERCYQRTFRMLEDIPTEELNAYIRIQERLNKAFQIDVNESITLYEEEKHEI